MAEGELLRLARVEIDGLFGLYDHRIDLHTEDRVTLLHGVNGVGKTTTLRMIDAFIHTDMGYLGGVPFRRLSLEFLNGSSLVLTKTEDSARSAVVALQNGPGTPATMKIPLGTDAHVRPRGLGGPTPNLLWTLASLMSTPPSRDKVRGRLDGLPADTPVGLFLEEVDSHFIEARRLEESEERTRVSDDVASFLAFSRMRARQGEATAVADCCRDFGVRLAHAMADYARRAQALDQAFPQQLVADDDPLATSELHARLADLDRRTQRLRAIGILEETNTPPFDAACLTTQDRTRRQVMHLFVQQTRAKLAVLDDFAGRTERFLSNVNSKYRRKRVRLDRSQGLVIEADDGQELQPGSLSSGEQHELVLQYELLFRAKRNMVVLIDEPELSLHVTWQKQFLPDLLGMAELTGFDAIVATHSPYIAGHRDDLMVGLGNTP